MAADVPGITAMLFPKAIVNAFLVEADVLTLIDTGTPGGVGKTLKVLQRSGRRPEEVERIILTHRHADHAGNARTLASLTGARVHTAPEDAAYVRDGSEQPRPQVATPLGRVLVPYVKVALPWRLDSVPAVQEFLADESTVGSFRVLRTPGHTAGHVSLLWPERGILFTGDAAAHITALGPHPAADDPEQARESFRRLSQEDFDSAYFGHGRPIKKNAGAAFRAAC